MKRAPLKIRLKIKAKDFKRSYYSNYKDCAITRALARAGHPQLCDNGGNIAPLVRGSDLVIEADRDKYSKLGDLVVSMYLGEIPPKDFQRTVHIRDYR